MTPVEEVAEAFMMGAREIERLRQENKSLKDERDNLLIEVETLRKQLREISPRQDP